MKTFLKNTLFFIGILIIVTLAINLFQTFYNAEPRFYKNKFSVLEEKNNATISGIIIGTSHATHSIRPKQLDTTGIKFYNFALNGANPKYFYHWYTKIFKASNLKPKHCIFNIDFFMFDPAWLWRDFEQDAEYFPDSLFIKELFTKKNSLNKKDLIINRFPFLKYRKQINKSLVLQKGDDRFNMNDYNQGYITYSIPYNDTYFTPVTSFKNDTVQLSYFRKLITLLNKENINIYFVMVPEYGIEKKQYENMSSLDTIQKIATQFKIPILNFNTQLRSNINDDIKYFSDWGHMNGKGSLLFSKMLAKEMITVMKMTKH